ncbi:ZP domain-containing protein [Aphelenchoides besseyi]|nr:ZP domain-containing protein [Aphelenchoides besseyi]
MRNGKQVGQAIESIEFGNKLLHIWRCDYVNYGVLLKDCYATDGDKRRAELIDSRGCSADPVLFPEVVYSDDLETVYVEAAAFKFVSHLSVKFFCHIELCLKELGLCSGITPPDCSQSLKKESRVTKEVVEKLPLIAGQLSVYDASERLSHDEENKFEHQYLYVMNKEVVIPMAMAAGLVSLNVLFVVVFMCFKQYSRFQSKEPTKKKLIPL